MQLVVPSLELTKATHVLSETPGNYNSHGAELNSPIEGQCSEYDFLVMIIRILLFFPSPSVSANREGGV